MIIRTATGCVVVALSLVAALRSSAGDVPNPTRPYDLTHAKTFSNICVHRETGDVLGLRVFVREPGSNPRVLGQYAEGGLLEPVAAQSQENRGSLAFVLPGDVPEATFSGDVRGGYVVVRSHEEGSRPFRLRLRNDTHGFPFCR